MPKLKPKPNQKKMRKREEVLIVGKGGDGVVLIGEILGLAATMEGKFASQRNNYGPSQRGEALFTEIIISDEPIQYTFVESPTYYISLSQQGFDASYNRLIEESRTGSNREKKGKEKKGYNDINLFIEYTNKFDLYGLDDKFKTYKLKAKQAAIENNLPLINNIIILASFISKSNIVSKESIRKALLQKISSRSQKQNLQAFEIGWNIEEK